jgi:hypothetical protein
MCIGRRLFAVAVLAAATASCGDVVRQGQSPVFLVIDSLTGSAGGPSAGPFSATLRSPVIVNRTSPAPCTPESPCPTVFNDSGQAVLRILPKDIGIAPTTNNAVTITRYRVTYRRADGRNVPGVDVPYAFDGAVTATVLPSSTATIGFELVRHVSKEEAPLAQLRFNPSVISTLTEVTFYGADLVGNDVSVTGTMTIDFGNFGG